MNFLLSRSEYRLETFVIEGVKTNGWAKDGEAFSALYAENLPRLRAFLQQIVGSFQAAEDLAQDIFVHLWSNPDAFDPAQGTIQAYLFGIGRHRAADWWRGHKPQGPFSKEPCAKCDPERSSMLTDALQRLPEEQRSLLWLREIEGQSYAELALIFDVPIGTVRSRLFLARHALKHIWLGGAEGGQHEVR